MEECAQSTLRLLLLPALFVLGHVDIISTSASIFLCEMIAGTGFRTSAWPDGGLTFMRQSTYGHILEYFDRFCSTSRWTSDPEVHSLQALHSRDCAVHAGVFNATDIHGKPEPVDPHAFVVRSTCMDQSRKIVARKAASLEESVQEFEKEKPQQVHLLECPIVRTCTLTLCVRPLT